MFDENGNPNTLSIIAHRQDGVANSWKLVYNYALPGQVVIATIGNGPGGTRPGSYSNSHSGNQPLLCWSVFVQGQTGQGVHLCN